MSATDSRAELEKRAARRKAREARPPKPVNEEARAKADLHKAQVASAKAEIARQKKSEREGGK